MEYDEYIELYDTTDDWYQEYVDKEYNKIRKLYSGKNRRTKKE